MTTHKIEAAHEPLIKQKFNWLLAIGIFIVGLGLGALVTSLPIAKTQSGEQHAAGPILRDVPARPDLAEPEREAIEAEAARSNGLVDGVKDGPGALAWPPRPTQFHIAENAGSLDENPLAAYHQSERDFTSIVSSRTEENALDAYHQIEWGRPLSPGLPSVKNESDADQDIGLMEFFTVPDETSRPRPELSRLEALPNIDPTDRKFFSPRYGAQTVMSGEAEVLPTVVKNEIDPDEDIGLLEFFSPGHGVVSGVSKEAETLPNIETDMDADLGLMEFFSILNEAGASQAIETHADQDIGLMEFRP